MSSGINWDGGGIPDAAHLRTLPDGTIISWLRVPGDRTSEAVAFVRREVSSGVLDHGGTWAREKALECASRVNTGRGGPAAITLAMASEFQDYLEADDEEPGTEIVQVTVDVTVPPLGEVRVRYSDGRVDELNVDQWEGPKPVRNAPVMIDPNEVPLLGEVADVLRPLKDRGLTKESAEYVIGKVYE